MLADTSQDRFIIKQEFTLNFSYDVLFTKSAFAIDNPLIKKLISATTDVDTTAKLNSPKILAVIDSGLATASPKLIEQLTEYFEHQQLNLLPPMIVPGGEQCKNQTQVIDDIYQAVESYAIDRHSYILAIGGGAVIDAIGFAAATAHRGIRLIRMPSTVLAQNDAGVGVKNAVNYHKRKNYIGTFAPPYAVINDFALLDSLSCRDKRSGISESIKVALIKDAPFFYQLFDTRHQLANFEENAMKNMIIKGAQWHLNHIATSGDPFELGSARPLDYGHWSAHKLEEISHNELRHGEAVAIGIAIDSIYSHLSGFLNKSSLDEILQLLIDLGYQLAPSLLAKLDVSQALNEFKEHLGGSLCITLLNGIGDSFEVNEIDVALMTQAITQLQQLPPHIQQVDKS